MPSLIGRPIAIAAIGGQQAEAVKLLLDALKRELLDAMITGVHDLSTYRWIS